MQKITVNPPKVQMFNAAYTKISKMCRVIQQVSDLGWVD